MNNICPKGYICVNHFNAIMLVLLIVFLTFLIFKDNLKQYTLQQQLKQQQQLQQQLKQQQQLQQQQPQPQQQYNTTEHDRRVISNPLYPPLKRGIPINEETRESGGDFQQLGILSKNTINDDNGTPGNNTDSVVLPLYGKQTYRGSNKWLYYTETDKQNAVKIPISLNNKDCTDDHGCEEVYDNDTVTIPSYNGVFNVKIYKFNKPRYIPF